MSQAVWARRPVRATPCEASGLTPEGARSIIGKWQAAPGRVQGRRFVLGPTWGVSVIGLMRTCLVLPLLTLMLLLPSASPQAGAEPGSSPRSPVARVIADASDLLGGPGAEGQLGDILLRNDEIALIVEAAGHIHGSALSGGHVIDGGAAPLWYDEFGQSVTLLGVWPRQAVYDTVRVESDGASGEAIVLAVGRDSDDPNVTVRTRYSLSGADRFVSVTTEIGNNGPAAIAYQAGDAITWGHTLHFLPGYGFDASWISTVSEWLAGRGEDTCYGYCVAEGTFPATHGSSWSDPLPLEAEVAAGGTASFTRYLIVASPDLASVSDVVHEIRGRETGTLQGGVADQSTNDPIPGAVLDVSVNGIAPYTQMVSDTSGLFHATLPPVDYVLNAAAEEYSPDEVPFSIAAYELTELDVLLRPASWSPSYADTLTVIARPILSVPVITTPGGSFVIEALAPEDAGGWSASISRGSTERAIALSGVSYSADHARWFLTATVPQGVPEQLYDLRISTASGVSDTAGHAVAVRDSIDDTFYFVQVSDTHTPTHRYWYQSGAESDTSELADLRAVIDDVNLMNPAFLMHTGDLVNEGELEDFLDRHYFTKAQRVLGELEVPLYMVPGNHDIGGWGSTPPPDGTARRAWWRFFGWRTLYDPPPGDPRHTQDYSFDHGGVHFTGLEAYDNYDGWRFPIYGAESFTGDQLAWLATDLSLADPAAAKVLFYHYDFANELSLSGLGVDCALWGHIHSTTGSISQPPYNLSLDACCDGGRWMRVVRVVDGVVHPSSPIPAGSSGQRLRVSYDPGNDGTHATVTATIVNEHPQSFEDGLVRFRVPADSIPYEVDQGTLRQTVVEGETAVCYVAVPIAASGMTIVTIHPSPEPPEPPVTRISLAQSHPNPARTVAFIAYALPEESDVLLEVLDVAGRRVATLVDGPVGPGRAEAPWDLRDSSGEQVAAGIYFVRLEAGGESLTNKLVVIK